MVIASALSGTWRESVLLVKPETILRWHRQGFQMFWRWRTRYQQPPRTRISIETIELIRRVARENRLWGAERIRGELLKLGIRVAKRTVQSYLKRDVQPHPTGQRGQPSSKTTAGTSGRAISSRPTTSGFGQSSPFSSSMSQRAKSCTWR
jgi:hypothetical protein